MDGLYHFELGFPKGLKTKFGVVPVTYTRHAKQASMNDRYGRIDLPKTINTSKAKAIEVEIKKGAVTKIVYRTKYNTECDLIMVMSRDCSIRTVWLNKREDKHTTLDESKYVRPTKQI